MAAPRKNAKAAGTTTAAKTTKTAEKKFEPNKAEVKAEELKV